METLGDAIAWFLEHRDDEPDRVHIRPLWVDYEPPEPGDYGEQVDLEDLVGGSRLGTPALHPEFRDWLERPEWATVLSIWDEYCNHPSVSERDRERGVRCLECQEWDRTTERMVETGRRKRTAVKLRWAMRAAMARIVHVQVPDGWPNYAAVLGALWMEDGDVARVAQLLARSYPVMGDERIAARHVGAALKRLKRLYTEHPPAKPVRGPRRSESQLDAEAAARNERAP